MKLAVGSHCCHCSLLAVVNFTASSHCWPLPAVNNHCWPLLAVKIHCCPLPAVNSHCFYCQQLPLFVHARGCMCAEVYMYHSTGKLSTCMPFYNVLTQSLIPLEGKCGYSPLLLPLCTRACERARAYVCTYTIQQARFVHACRFIPSLHKTQSV